MNEAQLARRLRLKELGAKIDEIRKANDRLEQMGAALARRIIYRDGAEIPEAQLGAVYTNQVRKWHFLREVNDDLRKELDNQRIPARWVAQQSNGICARCGDKLFAKSSSCCGPMVQHQICLPCDMDKRCGMPFQCVECLMVAEK